MARGVRRRHLPASKWGRRRIVLSGPTLPPSISMSGAQSCRRQEACGQVDSRSAPDHFPTGPTTTEAVNSSGTQTGQLHRHQNHTPPKTANTRGSRPSSTGGACAHVLRVLRIGAVVEGRRGRDGDAGGDPAPVEGDPDGAGEVHVPGLRADLACARPTGASAAGESPAGRRRQATTSTPSHGPPFARLEVKR